MMRFLTIATLLFSISVPVFAETSTKSGEGEMSAKAQTFKKNFLDAEVTKFKSMITQALGTTVDVKVDVSTFDVDYGNGSVLEDGGDVIKGFKNNCFTPIYSVIEEMAKDPKMKKNMARKFKKIEIKNVKETDEMWGNAQFENETFSFRAPATTNIEGPYSGKIKGVIGTAFKEHFKK